MSYVMLVDDDHHFRKQFTRLLRLHEIPTMVAVDLDSALVQLRADRLPRVLVINLDLAANAALKLLQALQAPQFSPVTLVGLSGHGLRRDTDPAMQSLHHVVLKPIRWDALGALIQDLFYFSNGSKPVRQ